MKTLTSIVAANRDGAIGAGNRLPWRVRSDLRFFREQTIEQVVIMGRKTFDSLNQRGLPDRKNVIVTHGFGMMAMPTNCRSAGSIEEALLTAEDWRSQRQKVFVVGGASMYAQFAQYVDRYLVTLIEKTVPDADTFFQDDDLGNPMRWSMREVASGKADGANDEADFRICEFLRADMDAALQRNRIFEKERNRRADNSLIGNRFAVGAMA